MSFIVFTIEIKHDQLVCARRHDSVLVIVRKGNASVGVIADEVIVLEVAHSLV